MYTCLYIHTFDRISLIHLMLAECLFYIVVSILYPPSSFCFEDLFIYWASGVVYRLTLYLHPIWVLV